MMDCFDKFTRKDGRLLVISGPAASGKTTICKRLQETFPTIARVITATTRPSRGSEIDGVDYHFLSTDVFQEKVAAGDFLEWAEVHGNLYGTPIASVLAPLQANADLILNIDVQGANTLRRKARKSPLLADRMTTLFILPPSIEELRRRIIGRGRDPEDEIEYRMENALREMESAHTYDYVLVSGSYEDDAIRAASVWRAEKMRVRA